MPTRQKGQENGLRKEKNTQHTHVCLGEEAGEKGEKGRGSMRAKGREVTTRMMMGKCHISLPVRAAHLLTQCC